MEFFILYSIEIAKAVAARYWLHAVAVVAVAIVAFVVGRLFGR